MKKILFFETNVFTGATRVTRTLAQAAKDKYQVAFAQVGDKVEEDIESAIEKESPDILFSSFITINPDVIRVGKKKGLYVVVRNDYNFSDVPDEIKIRAINAYSLADEIIAQTADMRQDLIDSIGLEPDKIRVVENPLDEEDILEKSKAPNPFSDNGKFHFLWVGRKDPIKDITTLQKAFAIVHAKYHDTDLTLVSDDPNPYRWMKNAGCMVISSISEASPNVLREAFFLGTEVISTDCSPTVRQYLPANRICPVKDAQEMANLMVSVLNNQK